MATMTMTLPVLLLNQSKTLWENRLLNDNGSRCKITLDGADFSIQESIPVQSGWHTEKFRGPGLRCKVGIGVQSGCVMWINGPFPCGEWPDLKIAMSDLVNVFEGDGCAVAGSGHRGHPLCFDAPWRILDGVCQRV